MMNIIRMMMLLTLLWIGNNVQAFSILRNHRPTRRIPRFVGATTTTAVMASKNNNKSSTTPKKQPGKTMTSRKNRISALEEWAKAVNIRWPPTKLALQSTESAGLGWFAKEQQLADAGVVLSVPSNIALTVECPGNGPDDSSVNIVDNKNLPWFVQFAVYLNKLDASGKKAGDGDAVNYRPWLDSLPRQFDTPIHWDDDDDNNISIISQLQYDYMTDAVARQRTSWQRYHDKLNAADIIMSWEDFVWGCECARSRAFSGGYTGSAFNPSIYAFTLLLVTAYVGLNLGTLEQAANGAGVVVAVSILKDFVIPKLFKKKRYVICPMIDMANHKSVGTTGEVSFEYFGNSYSLAIAPGASVAPGEQLYISYGDRSNDQLLQYYGFVEPDNPHDVYVMPPLREWNIDALERACGRKFAPGRLQKLDRAGLLGVTSKDNVGNDDNDDDSSKEEAANVGGGVVLSRAIGIDPAVLQALRALVSTDQEWDAAGGAIGNFAQENSGGLENEQCARLVAKTAIEMELESKATTIEQDQELLKKIDSIKSLDTSVEERLAIQFRIEKKKLLQESISKLQ